MTVIGFSNLKGGSAKTTSALAIGSEAALRGRSVLMIDLDPQATLTLSAGLRKGPVATELLLGNLPPREAALEFADVMALARKRAQAVDPSGSARLDEEMPAHAVIHVIPADRTLIKVERTSPVELSMRMLELLHLVEKDYDLVVIDTPPQASSLVTAGLATVDHTIVPVSAGRGALDGLHDVMELTERLGMSRVAGAFATRVNLSSIHDRTFAEKVGRTIVGAGNEPAIGHYVRETVRVRESEMARVPLAIYARESTAGRDYASILDDIDRMTVEA